MKRIALVYLLILASVILLHPHIFSHISYNILVYAALVIASLFIMSNADLRYPAFIIFLPFALFPFIRCYFKVPFIFCQACPRKCPFGNLRLFIIPAFLLKNLKDRHWCYKLCPVGTLQDWQGSLSGKRICLPGWISSIRYFFLAFTLFIVISLLYKPVQGFFFRGVYNLYLPTLAIFMLIFAASFFIPRFWCNCFCPVGTLSSLILKIRKKSYR